MHLPVKVFTSTSQRGKVIADLAAEAKKGTKRALLVGISYRGQKGELGGCINDVLNMRAALTEGFEFDHANVRCMTEDEASDMHPTCANIKRELELLVNGAKDGDILFFSYSGHGSQVKCTDGSEADGYDEVLIPLDYQKGYNYIIKDDYIHEMLHDKVPDGVRVIANFDCCHSGSMADLPVQREIKFFFDADEEELAKIKAEDVPEDVVSRFLALPQDLEIEMSSLALGQRSRGADVLLARDAEQTPPKSFWVVSGCQDNQTSADALIDGKRQGAMTWALVQALKEHGWQFKYKELLSSMKEKLKKRGFEQVPSISTTHEGLFNRHFLENAPVLAIPPIPVPAPAPQLSPSQGVFVADFTDDTPDVIRIGLGWSVSGEAVDLDASAIFLDADKRKVALAFYNDLSPSELNGAVKHHGDNRTGAGSGDDETITIDLAKLPQTVQYIGIVINAYSGAKKLSSVKDAYCRLYNAAAPGVDLCRFELKGRQFDSQALVMAVLHCTARRWFLLAAGEGAAGRSALENVDEVQAFVASRLSKKVHTAIKPLTVRVTVPADVKPGSTMEVSTPGGYSVTVPVPHEATPGSVLEFQVQPGYTAVG